ncbi:hypothetical protein Tco_0617123, partial [Tanacetum coccineum]
MIVQANQEEGVDSGIPTDSDQTPITTQPSSSRSHKKQPKRKQRKDTAKRVQKLERKKRSRTTGLQRLRKVGKSRRVESSEDKESLGDHEDASKHGRSIKDIDNDADVSLVDDTQGRSNNEGMFDTNDLHGNEVNVDMPVGEKQEQSAKEREINTSVKDSAALTTIEKITLAQTLIQIKSAKPKAVTTVATTTTTTRPKSKVAFIPIDSEEVKSKKETEESSKGTKDELKSNKSRKAKDVRRKLKAAERRCLDDKETDEHEEVEADDEVELKKHLVIVKDDDIAIDAIPLATKPPVIVEYKLLKEGIMVHYPVDRAVGSLKDFFN